MLKRVLGYFERKMGIQRRVRWYLKKLNYSRKVLLNGEEIIIPSIYGITCKVSEPWMTDFLGKIFPIQQGTFLDVGVNVGQTLVQVKAIERQREYIGFEPNPACGFYLRELIKKNQFKNCTFLLIGLYTKDCILSIDFYYDDETDSAASLIDNFRPDNKVYSRVFVPVFEFDSLTKFLDAKIVGIVKIDVEGAELEVLKSLLKLIQRNRPIILIEVLPVYSDENTSRKDRQKELEMLLDDIGYVILRIEKTIANTYSGLRRVEKIGIHSDLTQCDYVIVPNEGLTKLQMAFDISINK